MAPAPKKTAWVIGASSGLGAALSVRLANNGYDVAISARRFDRLNALADAHQNLTAFPADAGDHAGIKTCAETILATYGHIDLFVYCAVRGGKTGSIHQDIVDGMEVGLFGASSALEPIITNMRQRKSGHIALIGSPVGIRALPDAGNYGVVKSALHYFAESLKLQLRTYNVDVQLILPGFVDTALTQNNTFPMPFLMSLDEATDRIWRGLQKPKRFKVAFPRRLIWPMHVLTALPDGLYHYAMRLLTQGMTKHDVRKK